MFKKENRERRFFGIAWGSAMRRSPNFVREVRLPGHHASSVGHSELGILPWAPFAAAISEKTALSSAHCTHGRVWYSSDDQKRL